MKKIFVAGHNGMVGSAICRALEKKQNISLIVRPRSELDLLNQEEVKQFFEIEKPDEVILSAAKVGGIRANNLYPAEFIYQNLEIQNNIIHLSYLHGVKKLLFLGSSCIYPKLAPQPMAENQLLKGELEPTNEPYAIAKIAGIKMCESYNRQYGCDFRAVMPTNLYGPGDNYDVETSHVLPALIKKFHIAKIKNMPKVIVWGTGEPFREFMFVDDMAEACLFINDLPKTVFQKNQPSPSCHVNIGTGQDITIRELAELVKKITDFPGKIEFDIEQPNGTPRKLLDTSLLEKFGWRFSIPLEIGIKLTYEDFLSKNNLEED